MKLQFTDPAYLRCPKCYLLSEVVTRIDRYNIAFCCGRIIKGKRANPVLRCIIANYIFILEIFRNTKKHLLEFITWVKKAQI